MDSGMIFAVALAILFFSTITWLVVYSRRRERQDDRNPKPLSEKDRRD
jgi:hypothetical protein